MSGICGIIHLDPLPINSSIIINRMNEKLRHRGPDEKGIFAEKNVALGFRRLSIIDLEGGRQPLKDEAGRYRLVFNGTIYNSLKLREELLSRGHQFRTACDAEVVLHLFEEMGAGCLPYLRGMFAFAIWDRLKKRLFLARDRFGIKPLYYLPQKKGLVFASELKAFQAFPGFQSKLNEESFQHYLTFQYVPGNDTILKNVYRLPPAHYLIWQDNKTTLEQYWELTICPQEKPLTFFIEGIQERLQDAVSIHRRSDVERGAFLSSGVDSSCVVALLRRMEEVKTYSVGCAGGKYNELPQAAQTASFLDTQHRDTKVSSSLFWEKLPEIIWYQDEPVADPAAAALYFVAGLAAKDVKVVLSGEGADEVFGGYSIYREPLSLMPFTQLPFLLKEPIKRLGKKLPKGFKGKSYIYRATTPLEKRYFGNAFIFNEEEKDILIPGLRKPGNRVEAVRVTEPIFQKASHLDTVSRMQYLDFYTWLPGDILAKADRMTMAHSLELRVPFLDHILVEFAATLPTRFKIGGKTTKYAFRKAAESWLPSEVASRPKLGFPVPVADWMKQDWKENLADTFQSAAARNYFNTSFLASLLEEHLMGTRNNARKLWTVAVFLLWHKIFIEGEKDVLNQVNREVMLKY